MVLVRNWLLRKGKKRWRKKLIGIQEFFAKIYYRKIPGVFYFRKSISL